MTQPDSPIEMRENRHKRKLSLGDYFFFAIAAMVLVVVWAIFLGH